jgi:hypothetical protein
MWKWFSERKERSLRVSLARVQAELENEKATTEATGVYYPIVMQKLVGEEAKLAAELAELASARARYSGQED